MFFKYTNRKDLINDLVKNAVVLLISHILLHLRTEKKLFDEDSMYVILFILLGYAFYHIIVSNIIHPL